MKIAIINVVFVVLCCCLRSLALPPQIMIGGVFDAKDTRQELAFRFAVDRVNKNNEILPRSRLNASIARLEDDNSFDASKKVCNMLQMGVAGIFGPQSENTANHIQSICDAMEVPHIETRWDYKLIRDKLSLNLYPHPTSLSVVYREILQLLEWKKFVILYDSNEGLVRLQSVLKEDSWKYNVRKLGDGPDYRPLLKDIRSSHFTKILINVALEKIPIVLNQAAMIGLIGEYYNYFITDLDFNSIDLDISGTNITYIQMIDPASEPIQQVLNEWMSYGLYLPHNQRKVTTEAALMYDAVALFAKALEETDKAERVSITDLRCETNSFWAHGESLINHMKKVGSTMHTFSRYQHGLGDRFNQDMGFHSPMNYNLSQLDQLQVEGLTGIIKFDSEGFRSEFMLDIMETDGKRKPSKVGEWNMTRVNLTRSWSEVVDQVEQTLQDKNLVVSIAVTPPYVMHKKDYEQRQGNDRYEGFCIDLIKEVAKITGRSGFNFTFKVVPDGAYGSKKNGEWNGIVRELLDHKADLGIVDLTITFEREEAVDFSTPFLNLGISILYRKPQKPPPQLFSFMSPFSGDVWLYMATAYLGVSVLLFVLARMSPEEWNCPYPCIQEPEELENCFTMSNSLWFMIATYLCQGADIAPSAVSTRIVAGIWWFFTLIMISSYTANLAAFLTAERMVSPVESAEDLANQNKIKYGCKIDGSTYNFFRNSRIPTYKLMWTAMSNARPSVFTESNDLGVERVAKSEDSKYAFLMESSSIQYVIEKKCELMQVGSLLDSKSYGIALPPGSKYTGLISSSILKLKENGVLHKIKRYWWEKDSKCQKEEKKDAASAAELGLSNVGGVFVVMIGGIGLACITACCEFMWKARKLATDDGVSFTEELCKELLFIVDCRENSKPVRKKSSPASTDSSSIYGSTNYGYSGKK